MSVFVFFFIQLPRDNLTSKLRVTDCKENFAQKRSSSINKHLSTQTELINKHLSTKTELHLSTKMELINKHLALVLVLVLVLVPVLVLELVLLVRKA